MKKRLSVICLLLILLIPVTAQACEHKFGSWKTKTSATCTREGHQFKYCTKCDHWEQRHTPKLPHTPGEMTVIKAATCTEKGKQEAICQVCNNRVRYTIPMLEHNYGEMVVTKAAACTYSGTGEYTCADCGQTKRERIERIGHDWGEATVTKAPTCTATGTSEESCLRCGEVKKTTLDKAEHVYGEWTVTREPEGKRKGLRTSACTGCGRAREEQFYWEGTLYEGMAPCEEVIRLQEKLKDLGFYKGSIRSGKYGELTTSAVARFQESVGMDGTGIADQDTLGAVTIAWEKATGKTDAPALDAEEMENAKQAQTIEE